MGRGDLSLELPAMRAVGYRQVWEHLRGDYDAAEMRQRALAATRQLAKRQYTWLRAEAGCHWLCDDEQPMGRALALVKCALAGAGD